MTYNNKGNPVITWAHTQRQPHARLFLNSKIKKDEAAKATAPAVALYTAHYTMGYDCEGGWHKGKRREKY